MQTSTRQLADTVLLRVSGRVDHRSAAELEAALTAAAGPAQRAVVLDFSAVDYISSVGLRVLMVGAKNLREREAVLAIAGLQPVVAEIFAISRFDKVLAVHADVAGALAAVSAPALAAWQAGRAVT